MQVPKCLSREDYKNLKGLESPLELLEEMDGVAWLDLLVLTELLGTSYGGVKQSIKRLRQKGYDLQVVYEKVLWHRPNVLKYHPAMLWSNSELQLFDSISQGNTNTYDEVAKLLECDVTSARVRLHRLTKKCAYEGINLKLVKGSGTHGGKVTQMSVSYQKQWSSLVPRARTTGTYNIEYFLVDGLVNVP